MCIFSLLFYTGIAGALVPPCLTQLGPEFCPSVQALSNDLEPRYEDFRKEYPAIFPSSLTQSEVLEERLFPQLNKSRMEKDLRELTDPELFKSRYCNSRFGPLAQDWIVDRLHNITARSVYVDLVSNDTPQDSIVVRIPGLSDHSVSVGAHMDSINHKDRPNGSSNTMVAPGADDNGSGSVVLLEVFRELLSHVETVGPLQNEVQFHWYGGEEVGLRGSNQVFSNMRSESFPLRAMLNLDMVGYPGGGSDKIGVQQDHVDKNLTAFVTILVETYSTASAGNITCGYPCSDHATAFRYNYSSAMIGESAYIKGDQYHPSGNPFIHSAEDTIENNIDFDYMLEFAKLALAFVVELGEYSFE